MLKITIAIIVKGSVEERKEERLKSWDENKYMLASPSGDIALAIIEERVIKAQSCGA